MSLHAPPTLRTIRPGDDVSTGFSFDIAQVKVNYLLGYRTLVRRRSPRGLGEGGEKASTRPPSPFRLIWRGRHWEAWEQGGGSREVLFHQALGGASGPRGKPSCSTVLGFAHFAGSAGLLVAAHSAGLTEVQLSRTHLWSGKDAGSNLPAALRSGVISGRVSLARGGSYSAWISGLFHRRIELSIDGRTVGSPRTELTTAGPISFFPHYVYIGKLKLDRGPHSVKLRYAGGGRLSPGTGSRVAVPALQRRRLTFSFGPLVLTHDDEDLPLTVLNSSEARSLCNRSWDWIEALGPPAGR